jgi:hypothetical protein
MAIMHIEIILLSSLFLIINKSYKSEIMIK